MSEDTKENGELFTHPRWHQIPYVVPVEEKKELTAEQKQEVAEWREKLKARGIKLKDEN